MTLYEQIDNAKNFGGYKEFPTFIKENLNPQFELRPYQIEAFRNFVTYFENENLHKDKMIHNLFHMATGSGKTLIMAGLMLYLYSKGYRNFLFFVNSTQIVKKTIDNFVNQASSKYLFAPQIKINEQNIKIRQVNTFEECNPNDINILFDTIQGLQSDLFTIKENKPNFEDFFKDKTVLIADEAHHLNKDTKSKEEADKEHSWESTVNRLKTANKENILLEFTATCDVNNSEIKQKYDDKIVFNYPLKEFRRDGYSKDIVAVRSDFSEDDEGRFLRALQAFISSQYKLKIFEKNDLAKKPVVLFKSKVIKESLSFMEFLKQKMALLSATDIQEVRQIALNGGSEYFKQIFSYFDENKITDEALANELRSDFRTEVWLNANEDKEVEKNQLLLNSLEDENNPYRVIFEVRKLDEGWDCLNLFDIVRLYETRDANKNGPGKSTIAEAQLIGRGARYCPFSLNENDDKNAGGDKSNIDDKYRRKYDGDVSNPLWACEVLHYHCHNDSRYINELNTALKEIGINDFNDGENKIAIHNELKESFMEEDLYKSGYVFLNKIEDKSFKSISEISEIKHEYSYNLASGSVIETKLLVDNNIEENKNSSLVQNTIRKTFAEIANDVGYNFIYSQMYLFPILSFDSLQNIFYEEVKEKKMPKFDSMKEFITGKGFLGNVAINATCYKKELSAKEWLYVIRKTLAEIASQLSKQKQVSRGSKEFHPVKFNSIFKKKGTERYYSATSSDGEGVSQGSCAEPYKYDLSNVDWYVYKDNFGTTEEKAFVKFFAGYVEKLKEKYSKVRLVRNELCCSIYSYNDGRKFEPDYLLFLKNKETDEYEYSQIFVEPKGQQLLLFDEWKENFLLELKDKSIPVVQYADDPKYKIWGLHFYCHPDRDADFRQDIENLLKEK